MEHSRMSQRNHPNNPPHLASNLSLLSLNPTAQPFQSTTSIAPMTSSAAAAPPETNKHGKPLTKNQLKQHQKFRGRIPGATKQSAAGQPLSSVPSISVSMTNKQSQTLTAKQKQTNDQERPPTNTYQTRSESDQSKSGQLIINRHGEPLGKKAREARQKQIAEVQARRDQEAKAEAARHETIALDQARREEELAKVKVERSQPLRVPENANTNVEALRDFIINTQRDITRRYAAMGHPAWEMAKKDERTLAEMWKKR